MKTGEDVKYYLSFIQLAIVQFVQQSSALEIKIQFNII